VEKYDNVEGKKLGNGEREKGKRMQVDEDKENVKVNVSPGKSN
jgi:hypothetical protein